MLEATRERSPAHYHVAVFPIQYEQYDQRLQSRRRSYVVQRGDALVRIARRTGTSVEALVAENGLTSNRIYPGTVLRIPN